MKKVFKTFFCLTLLLTLCMSVASAASLEEKKAEIQAKVDAALEDLYANVPEAQAEIENAEGYAVFVNSGYKIGIFGSSHGRGMAINNVTGQKFYMRMGEYSAGLGLGAKEYNVIFFFKTQDAFVDFVTSGWKFNGEAEAAADDGKKGGQLGGALNVGNNVFMYQMTTKGLTAELGLKGTEYYRDKSFYPKNKN